MKRAILHIDGDSFFASCEVSLNPRLRGLPVVTGRERGIATAMSKEAKALGIHRGMPVFKIKKLFPQVKILQSDYGTYATFAQRMYTIVRRFTPYVEEYSIDECFADLTGFDQLHGGSYEQMAREIKETLKRELDMTFSVGVGPTKVLAKVASGRNKPDGLTVLTPDLIKGFLRDLPVGKVWGIGPATSIELQKLGVSTALELIEKSEDWIEANLAKPYVVTWHELQGNTIYRVHPEQDEDYKSIQCTRTFTPPSSDKNFLLSELSKNIEGDCAKARRAKLSAQRIYYFLKTQEFRYHRFEIPLLTPLSVPSKIMKEVRETFDAVYRPEVLYRATGVTMAGLIPNEFVQKDLFHSTSLLGQNRGGVEAWDDIFKTVDKLDKRYGTHTVTLGSSLEAFKRQGGASVRRLKIPYMGEVV
jgi:DNA polymerase-4/DNA polymerase V